MKARLIAVLIMAALLAGCTGGGGAGEEGAPQATITPEGGGTVTQGQLTLEGLGYLALAQLGQPVECDVTTTPPQGEPVTIKLKILGENVRMEMDIPEFGKMVSIGKDKKSYVDMSGAMGQMYTMMGVEHGCDWVMSEQGEESGGQAVEGQQSVEDLEDIPPTDMKCVMGSFGQEAFATPGKVCTQEELEEAMMQGFEMP